MGYIVKTFGLGCDEVECSAWEDACMMARKIRRSGHLATIIDADAPMIRWHVTGYDCKPYDVLARSGEEALYKVQFGTNDYAYDTAQVVGTITVIVNRPDGTVDTINCMCLDEAMKYAHRYTDRGWHARVQAYGETLGE